jgi:hypothetical protein
VGSSWAPAHLRSRRLAAPPFQRRDLLARGRSANEATDMVAPSSWDSRIKTGACVRTSCGVSLCRVALRTAPCQAVARQLWPGRIGYPQPAEKNDHRGDTSVHLVVMPEIHDVKGEEPGGDEPHDHRDDANRGTAAAPGQPTAAPRMPRCRSAPGMPAPLPPPPQHRSRPPPCRLPPAPPGSPG